MTPTEVKDIFKEAVQLGSSDLAWSGVLEVIKQDFFIGYRAPEAANWNGNLLKKLSYPGRCNVCGREMATGLFAIWIKGKGIWHDECYGGEGE